MMKILAIDDQQDNLVTIKALLNMSLPDYEVVTASSGMEGIVAAENEHPEVILLDIKMPNMDGYEVCERLKKSEQTRRIPIIMLTAIRTDTASRVKALDLGADAFLLKPIDSVELIAQMHVMLRIKKAEDKLRKENTELEEQVKERTLEISEKNRKLSIEFEQREVLTQALVESEAKYRALYNNAPLAYQSLNIDASLRDVNPAWLSVLGYERDEVIGKVFFDFLHPDSRLKAEQEIFPEFKNCGFISNVEFKIRHKKGHYIDISYEGCAGYFPDGKFKQTYCVFHDVTERNQAQEALKESERKLQTLVNNLQGIAYRCKNDQYWTMEYISEGFEELTGYLTEDIINNKKISYNSLITPDDQGQVWGNVQKAINNKERFELNYKIKTASGKIVHVLEKGVGVYSPKNGKLIALEGFITDISESIKTSKELSIHNKRLEALLSIMQNKFASITELLDYTLAKAIDLTESKIGYIYFYNEESKQFTLNTWSGEVMKECAVTNPQTLYNLDDTGCWGEAVRQRKPFFINDYTKSNEFIKGIPKGHVALKNFLTVPIIVDQEIKAVVGVANKAADYTQNDIKQLSLLMDTVWRVVEKEKYQQELLAAKAKAEESDQLKTAFLANMSHEIRTPMNAVLGFSELILSKEHIEPDEKAIYAEYIRINGESLVKIIDDIIDISKIQIKQLSIKKVVFNLHLLLEELNLYYKRLLLQNTKKIDLKLDIPNNLEDKYIVNTDDTRLKQVLNNLISNAIKYSDKGQIIFGYKEFKKKIYFFIKDTGIGISEENQAKIFERFFQHSSKYIARQEGTGLGLAISKELVELLGGELKVESVLGEGSTFYFELPLQRIFIEDKEKEDSQEHQTNTDLSTFKLLIADDEESNYVLTKRLLKPTKIKTAWAANGKEALEMIANSKFDLIIMDIKMPEMDGIEATRLIKQNNKQMPVIIQTAFAMPETKEEAFKAGCNDLIVKPISIGVFLELVNKHLKK